MRTRPGLRRMLVATFDDVRGVRYGRATGPAVAVVGVWDPFLSSHESLLISLRDRAYEAGLSSVAVLIDPAPGTFSNFAAHYGAFGWPVYDSVPARIELMRHIGLDAVLVMRFSRRDFGATAAEFLDAARAYVDLEELWLGAVQLLGPGSQGGREAVADYAGRHGFRLIILPRPPLGGADVRSLLAAGRVRDATDVVGRPPTWRRPRSGTLRLAWRPGQYRAIAIERPGAPSEGAELGIALTANPNAPASLTWPGSDIRYLAFTAGPADPRANMI
jgi:hypothetical protein